MINLNLYKLFLINLKNNLMIKTNNLIQKIKCLLNNNNLKLKNQWFRLKHQNIKERNLVNLIRNFQIKSKVHRIFRMKIEY
jgi:hypothetical protein